MRGKRAFKELVNDVEQVSVKTIGRNPELVAARNRLIATRYFYYAKILDAGFAYEEIIKRLALEFFLSHLQITKIIADNGDEIRKLKSDPPTPKKLSKDYSFMCW